MAYVPVEVIEVSAWDRQVGAVALDPSIGFYVFEYSPEWVNSPVDLAPTTMPVHAQPYVFPTLPVDTFYRLPALLADALPDAFGNALVEKELTSQGVRPSDIARWTAWPTSASEGSAHSSSAPRGDLGRSSPPPLSSPSWSPRTHRGGRTARQRDGDLCCAPPPDRRRNLGRRRPSEGGGGHQSRHQRDPLRSGPGGSRF